MRQSDCPLSGMLLPVDTITFEEKTLVREQDGDTVEVCRGAMKSLDTVL